MNSRILTLCRIYCCLIVPKEKEVVTGDIATSVPEGLLEVPCTRWAQEIYVEQRIERSVVFIR